jgi:hypothetical protein
MLGCLDEPCSCHTDEWGGSLHGSLYGESDGELWWRGHVQSVLFGSDYYSECVGRRRKDDSVMASRRVRVEGFDGSEHDT